MALGISPQQIIEKNENPLLRIDDAWSRVLLKDISEVQNGFAFSSKNFNSEKGIPLIRIRDIKNKKTENLYNGEYDEAYIVNNNDILIGMDGDFHASRWPGRKGLLNQRVCRLNFHSDNYYEKFFFLCLQPYLDAIHKETSSVTVKHLSSNTIKQIPLPLPPLPIQRALVTKIENLFASLDKGIADLKKAQEQLKVYRQAVLKKAFEESPDTVRKKISDIVHKVQIGPFGSQLHKEDYITNGIPLINPMHIQEGKIKPNPSYSISEEKRNNLPNYILEKGDVIMGRRGEMGRCGFVDEKEVGWFCGTGSLYLRPNKEIVYAPFLFYYLRSSIVKEFLTGSATGTTMMNLNKKIVSSIPIFLSKTIKEQRQCVKDIESRLSVCDKVEQNITEVLEKSEALRQSILKKAFEGKLLSEAEIEQRRKEEDYEPANVLLDKIKKEKKN